MIIRRSLLALLISLCLCGVVQAAQYNPPEVSRTGMINAVDIASNEMIVEGHRYSVSPTAQVEIAGSYGAFTMLNSGMRIVFQYYRYDDGRREIFYVRELLASETMEQA